MTRSRPSWPPSAEPGPSGQTAVMGLLFDLGVSSPQLDDPERGFAYAQGRPPRHADGPIAAPGTAPPPTWSTAIRPPNSPGSCATTGRSGSPGESPTRWSASIARAPITSTQRQSAIVKDAIPAATRRTGGNPAKRTFQALRIEVNDELGTLRRTLPDALDVLAVWRPRRRAGVPLARGPHPRQTRARPAVPPTRPRPACPCPRARPGRSFACSPGVPSAPTAKKSPAIRARPPPGCGPRNASARQPEPRGHRHGHRHQAPGGHQERRPPTASTAAEPGLWPAGTRPRHPQDRPAPHAAGHRAGAEAGPGRRGQTAGPLAADAVHPAARRATRRRPGLAARDQHHARPGGVPDHEPAAAERWNLARQQQILANEVAQAANPAAIAEGSRAARHAAEPRLGFIDLKSGRSSPASRPAPRPRSTLPGTPRDTAGPYPQAADQPQGQPASAGRSRDAAAPQTLPAAGKPDQGSRPGSFAGQQPPSKGRTAPGRARGR